MKPYCDKQPIGLPEGCLKGFCENCKLQPRPISLPDCGYPEISDKEKCRLALPEGGLELNIIRAVQDEYRYATKKYHPFYSAHDGLGIIEEEYEEFKKEVFRKRRDYPELRKEAIQLATMALRFVKDICDDRTCSP